MLQKGQWRTGWACVALFFFTTLALSQRQKSQNKLVVKRNPAPIVEFAETVTQAFKLFAENVAAIDPNHTTIVGRSLLDGLLGGGGASNTTGSTTGGSSSPLSALAGLLGGGNASSSISGLLGNAASGLLGDVAGGLGGPAFYLGVGLGAGTAQGLNLSTPANSMQVAKTVAQGNTVTNSSLNMLAQNLGTGLTASLISSANTSGLASSASSSIGPAVLSLAQGLGNGTSSGLQLGSASIQVQPTMPGNGSNLSVSDIAGLFGYGLSKSITQNIKLPNLAASNLTSSLSSSGLFKMIAPVASGFGKGLGEGIPIGLGLQQDTTDPTDTSATQGTGLDLSTTAQVFAKGFTSKFLANGTLSRLSSQAGASSLLSGTSSINIGKGAEGFARGLIQGVGNGVQSVRAAQAMLGGNFTAASLAQAPPTTIIAFNDTVGGAAVGFGYGLGDQGAGVVAQLFQKSTSKENSTIVQRALIKSRAAGSLTTSGTNQVSVNPRDIDFNSINLTALLTTNNIGTIAQKGVDDLTCEGVGGLVNVLLGLLSSKTLPSSLAETGPNSTVQMIRALLPNGTFTIRSNGNQYDIDLQDLNNIQINGLQVVKFVVLIVLHALFLILIFLLALPLLVTLRSLRSISLLAGRKESFQKSQRWADIIMYGIIPPVTIVGFGLGIAVTGNAKHFRSGHAILGFFTVLLTIPTVAFYYLSTKKPQAFQTVTFPPSLMSPISLVVLLNISLLTILLAFQDISTLSLCITQVVPFAGSIGLGIFLASSTNAAIMLQVLEWWLQRKGNGAKEAVEGQMAGEKAASFEISWPMKMKSEV